MTKQVEEEVEWTPMTYLEASSVEEEAGVSPGVSVEWEEEWVAEAKDLHSTLGDFIIC